MEVSRLPIPNIQQLQQSFDRLPAHTRELHRRRPPKLNTRYLHESNGNRSFRNSPASVRLISFRNLETHNSCDPVNVVGEDLSSDSNTTLDFESGFTNLEKIGEGSFGEVFKVRSKIDGRLYAIKMSKQFYRGGVYRLERLEEVRRCEQFSGQANCVRFYQAWEQDDRLYMQMELCRESLEQYLERCQHIPEKKIWSILLDLLMALKSLHDRNLIHLDIKLDNVLIGNDGSCKLADFGLVIDVDKAKRQPTEGDSRYMAPEIMQGTFSKAADIFSLGIAMLELSCFLELPANGPLWQYLRSGVLPEKFIRKLSPMLLVVIREMMSPQPEARPSVDQLLNHVLIKEELRQRRRWQTLKLLCNSMMETQRFIRSKLNDWKRFVMNCLTSLFAYITAGWQRLMTPTKNRPAPKEPSTMASLPLPSSGMQQNGKPVVPHIQLLCSTPTTKTNETTRARLNFTCISNEANSPISPRYVSATDHEPDELQLVQRQHCCSPSFVFETVVNSTPVHHYNNQHNHIQSLRSRKDLTKTSFRQVEGNDAQSLPAQKDDFVDIDLEIYNDSQSWMHKPIDTSSLVGKKLFFENDESD